MPLVSPAALHLAATVRDLLTTHPRLHDPNLWVARTAHSIVGCVGGWIALLDGAPLHHATRSRWRNGYMFDMVTGPTGAPMLIRDYAAARLGLTREERDQLLSEPDTTTEALTYLDTLIASAIGADTVAEHASSIEKTAHQLFSIPQPHRRSRHQTTDPAGERAHHSVTGIGQRIPAISSARLAASAAVTENT
ncbi:hypothetical protein ACW9HR_37120 [Nocardia gipuzkoensis]